ncbi:MAG: ATP synthase F1 subunit delta [Calditrichaeota bacterium]|nr:ATP synthase F1 subunit delta [Calditrichota bacterium]
MKHTVLAKRYARALFELAGEKNILVSVLKEVVSFEEDLRANANFRQFLYSQDVSKSEKQARMEEILQDRVSALFLNFLFVLLRKNRALIFPEIAMEFQAMVDRRNKRTRASAVTAVPLDDKAKAALKSVLDKALGLDVQVENEVDKSILGGVIVNLDGRLLDGSLRSQLRRLERQLVENRNSSS